jgi:hypothetical protein
MIKKFLNIGYGILAELVFFGFLIGAAFLLCAIVTKI